MLKKKMKKAAALVLAAAMLVQSAPEAICQAAEEAWRVVTAPDTPLDEVYYYAEGGENGKGYYYGYIDGKLAVMDEDYKLVKQTENTTYIREAGDAAIVCKGEQYGVMSKTGETVIEPQYSSIGLNGGKYYVAQKKADGGAWQAALLDLKGNEVIGFREGYTSFGSPIDKEGHQVISAQNDQEIGLFLDGTKIYHKGREENCYYTVNFSSYDDKECICLSLECYDGKTDEYDYFIDYTGKEIAAVKRGGNGGSDPAGEQDYLDACDEWLNQQAETDKKHAGELLSNHFSIKWATTQTGYIMSSAGMYYWTSVQVDVVFSDSDSKLWTVDYSSIYDTKGKCLISGKSFNKPGNTYYEGEYIVKDDGQLCYFDTETGKITEIVSIKEPEKAILGVAQVSSAAESEVEHLLKIDSHGVIKERWSSSQAGNIYLCSTGKSMEISAFWGDEYYVKENGTGGTDVYYTDVDYNNREKVEIKKIGSIGAPVSQLEWVDGASLRFFEGGGSSVKEYIFDKKEHLVYVVTPSGIAKQELKSHEAPENETCTCVGYADEDYVSILFQYESKSIWTTICNEDGSQYTTAAKGEDGGKDGVIASALEKGALGARPQDRGDKIYWCSEDSVICLKKTDASYSVTKMENFGKVSVASREETTETGEKVEVRDNTKITIEELHVLKENVYIVYNLDWWETREYDGSWDDPESITDSETYRGVMDLSGKQYIDATKREEELKEWNFGYIISCNLLLSWEKRNGDEIIYDSDFKPVTLEDGMKITSFSTKYPGCIRIDVSSKDGKKTYMVEETAGTTLAEIKGNIGSKVYKGGNYECFRVWDDHYEKAVWYVYDKGAKNFAAKEAAYIRINEKKKEIVVFNKGESSVPIQSEKPGSTEKPGGTPDSSAGPESTQTPGGAQDPSAGPENTQTPGGPQDPSAGPENTQTPGGAQGPSAGSESTQTPGGAQTSSAAPASSGPADDKGSVKNGEKVSVSKVEYQVTDAGKKTVEYVKSKTNKSSRVSIPAKVTIDGKSYKVVSVAKKAFKNDKNLKTVTIGSNVKTISQEAFAGCKNLTKVTLGKGVTKIESKAFYQCKKLRTITVKTNKLTAAKVGNNAFGKGAQKPTLKMSAKLRKKYKGIFAKKGLSKKAVYR